MPGSFTGASVSVTTTVTEITELNDATAWLLVRNVGTVPVYLGGSSVDTTGYPLYPGESLTVASQGNIDQILYAVTESGTADVRVLIA